MITRNTEFPEFWEINAHARAIDTRRSLLPLRAGNQASDYSEQDVVGSAGMWVEPIRLKQHVICGTISALSA